MDYTHLDPTREADLVRNHIADREAHHKYLTLRLRSVPDADRPAVEAELVDTERQIHEARAELDDLTAAAASED